MKKLVLIFLIVGICAAAGGVTLFKYKAPNYYMDQVHNVIQKPNASLAEIEHAFACLNKVRRYISDKEIITSTSDELRESAEQKGYVKAGEMQLNLLKKIIEEEPHNWHARELLLNQLSIRGDLNGLAEEVAALDKLISNNADINFCVKTAQLFAVSSSIPWLESEAYLNLNKSPDLFIEKTAIFSSAVKKTTDLRNELRAMAAQDPSLQKAPPVSLFSAADLATLEALKNIDLIERVEKFNKKINTDDNFKKAAEMALNGNVSLAAKKYSDARAMFRASLNIYPTLLDAKKQLAETDFQEGVYLLAADTSQKAADLLLKNSYTLLNELIEESYAYGPTFPFVNGDRFTGDSYALKAAVISAIRATRSKNNKKTRAMEEEFKTALDEALKLNPNSRMAKDLLDRYTKEGF